MSTEVERTFLDVEKIGPNVLKTPARRAENFDSVYRSVRAGFEPTACWLPWRTGCDQSVSEWETRLSI